MTIFTQTERRNLTKLLASAVDHGVARQEQVLTLDGLHGFLFGLAITPGPSAPNEWLPVIFGKVGLQLDDKKGGDRLLGNLYSTSNRISQLNQDGLLSFPFGERIKSKDVQRVQDWTRGLYLAVCLHSEILEKSYKVDATFLGPYESELEVTSCYSVIMGISEPEKITEYFQRSQGKDTELVKNTAEFLARLFLLLPKAVAAIQKHANAIRDGLIIPTGNKPAGPPGQRRVEKVGRNDPCPCESGSKYKKCCGK